MRAGRIDRPPQRRLLRHLMNRPPMAEAYLRETPRNMAPSYTLAHCEYGFVMNHCSMTTEARAHDCGPERLDASVLRIRKRCTLIISRTTVHRRRRKIENRQMLAGTIPCAQADTSEVASSCTGVSAVLRGNVRSTRRQTSAGKHSHKTFTRYITQGANPPLLPTSRLELLFPARESQKALL